MNLRELKFEMIRSGNFEEAAKEVFNRQTEHNKIYSNFLSGFKKRFTDFEKAPFLPIEFFKNHEIKTGSWNHEKIFRSSGTTGIQTSRHFIKNVAEYHDITIDNFNYFFNRLEDYNILALLPSYLERQDSSLVEMVKGFMSNSTDRIHGFFLDDFENLKNHLDKCQKTNQPTLLIGVSFALLDFGEYLDGEKYNIIVMETGGMKGRRKEIIRKDLHEMLKRLYGVNEIMSEYGMTELLSQSYAKQNGRFLCPPWKKVIIREINDPLRNCDPGETGVINVIDLANYNSCSFIQTSDLGKMHEDGTFEVLGRLDNSDIRGCNLMVV